MTRREPEWSEVWALIEDHPGGMSCAEIGEVFGVSRERIRQIEEGAIRKLRAILLEVPEE